MKFSTVILCSAMLMTAGVMSAFKHESGENRSIRIHDVANMKAASVQDFKTLRKPARVEEINDQVITDVTGEASYFTRSGIGYQNEWDMMVEFVAGKFVTDDNIVYIYNPLSFLVSGSYMKGELVDEETIKVEFPQLIYVEEWEGFSYYYYVNKMNFIFDEGSEEYGWYYVDEEDNTLYYTKNGDDWELQGTDMALTVLGMSDENGEWMGYADFMTVYTPFDEKPLTPPAGLETEEWAMTFGVGNGRFVKAGFLDDEMYIQGMFREIPEAWIKGAVSGNKVTFPSVQLLGTDRYVYHWDYFFGGSAEEIYDEEFDYTYTKITIGDELVFDYDSSKNILSTDGAAVLNSNPEYQSYFESVENPTLKIQSEDISLVPSTPVVTFFDKWEVLYGYGYIYFNIPLTNENGDLLNPDNLYFRMLLDDEPYFFGPDYYPGLEEDTDLVPIYFSNYYDIDYQGIQHFVMLYMEGYETLGLQAVYVDGDTEYASEICYAEEPPVTGIDELEGNNPVSVEYYDLTGRKISSAAKGIVICKKTFADGKTATSKVIRR